jgi:hypothetical protein
MGFVRLGTFTIMNDNAHSFSLRSSAPELQGHCRGIAAALQGRCKEYRLANK